MPELTSSPTATTAAPPAPSAPVDFAAVKTRQQAMWAAGDFAVIGNTLQIVGETLCEAVDLKATSRVLDVACGSGNAALAAARRWCKVTGLDYVPALLERARERAQAERMEVEWVQGDAEKLPFEDAHFDVALSTFGVMFAPDQVRAARELMRVVKPGGRVALANWTPEGFVGQMLKTVGRHVPPPAGVSSPAAWGVEGRLAELFPGVRALAVSRQNFIFRYESSAHFIDVFRRLYGPTFKAFAALEADGQTRLSHDLTALCDRFNQSKNSFAAPGEYLQVVIDR